MDIAHLESFVTLANVLSYTKAAEVLFITQPTLTRHIISLEKEVGCKLFDRSTHQVTLTDEGKAFLRSASKIVLTYRDATHSLQNTHQSKRQVLHVGYHRGGTQHEIAGLFRDFLAQHDDFQIQFHDGNHDDLLDLLKSGSHDLCFSMATTLAGEDSIAITPLRTLQTVLVVREDHALAERKSVTFEDFCNEPYLCVEKRITKAWFDFIVSYYIGHGTLPRFSGECTSVTTLLLMVDVGMGITILTEGCKNVMPPSLRAIPIDDIASPKSIVGHLETNTNPALDVFMKWLHAHLKHYS
ncbi:LysR family transcriptional regulator [Ruminococcaceae bacterium OttesenSCG-928-D13]|nr:LysR family transcriptional regulator [Ruminococcaceae bacterium OttesenSCG-928-D13]